MGEAPTLIKFSHRPPLGRRRPVGARSAPAGRPRRKFGGFPYFFDLWVKGTPTIITENVEFSAKTPGKEPKI